MRLLRPTTGNATQSTIRLHGRYDHASSLHTLPPAACHQLEHMTAQHRHHLCAMRSPHAMQSAIGLYGKGKQISSLHTLPHAACHQLDIWLPPPPSPCTQCKALETQTQCKTPPACTVDATARHQPAHAAQQRAISLNARLHQLPSARTQCRTSGQIQQLSISSSHRLRLTLPNLIRPKRSQNTQAKADTRQDLVALIALSRAHCSTQGKPEQLAAVLSQSCIGENGSHM